MASGTAISSSIPGEDDGGEIIDDLPPDDGGEDAAIEARAREMGWKPLAEYRGPPGRWQPARDFIDRGENILPIVRDQNRRLTERIGKLEGEVTGLRSTSQEQLQIIKDLRDMGARANQAGYDRAMAEIKANQRKAVAAGDTEAFDQLVEQAEALASSRSAAAAPSPPPPPPVATPPVPSAPALRAPTREFLDSNPWFKTDKLLSDTMVGFHREVLAEREATDAILAADPDLDRDLLDEAKNRVMAKYPERFGGSSLPRPNPTPPPRRRAAPVVQPTNGNDGGGRGGGAPTINSISDPGERAQAREAFNRMKRQLPDYTEAEYMALYDDPHGDVLTIQKTRSNPNGR